MSELRKIVHIDMDAFFASVEQRDNPELKGMPIIVGGRPEKRGVVAACSYEARKFGVHSAMPSSRAVKLCPEAVFVVPRFEAYRDASQQIHEIFHSYTDLVEPLSLDEAYLDVTEVADQFGSATELAKDVKQTIKKQVNLTASAGVSYNKFLAKVASDMDKPNGLFVIPPQKADRFLKSLNIGKFYGVGKVTEKKMNKLGIFTGADLRKFSRQQLATKFGRSGDYYYNIVRGIDDRKVTTHRIRKSIGCETTFEQNLTDKREIWQILQKLTERVAVSLTKKEMVARTVCLKVRYSDFSLITRSKTVLSPVSKAQDIIEVLPELLRKTKVGERPIRLIGVTVMKLKAINNENSETLEQSHDSQPPLF